MPLKMISPQVLPKDAIQTNEIDWGTGAGQVHAGDIPDQGILGTDKVIITKAEIDAAGGGNAYATRVVAASDSLGSPSADYVCDGTADEVEINSAISDLATTGGRIVLMEGTYYLDNVVSNEACIELQYPGIILEGQGEKTKLLMASGLSTVHGPRAILLRTASQSNNLNYNGIKNLHIDVSNNSGNSPTAILAMGDVTYSVNNFVIEGCKLIGADNETIDTYKTFNSSIRYNYITTGYTGGTNAVVVKDNDGGENQFLFNQIIADTAGNGSMLYISADRALATGNYIKDGNVGLYVTGGSNNVIVKNITNNCITDFTDNGTSTHKIASTTDDNIYY